MYIILNVVRIIASHVSCFYGKAIAKGDPGFQYYQYTDLTDSAAFAEYMERAHPMAPSSGIEQAQYAVEASANSVF